MVNVLERLSRIYRSCEYSTNAMYVFQDVCGPVHTWPHYIKKVLLSSTLNYAERLKLTTFFYVNGLRDPSEWVNFIVYVKGPSFIRYEREIISLFEYYSQNDTQRRYFSYCLTHKRYEFLDGTERRGGGQM